MNLAATSGSASSTGVSVRTRARDIEGLERLLSVWSEDQTNPGTALLTVKQNAHAICDDLKKQQIWQKLLPFAASRGWLRGFGDH